MRGIQLLQQRPPPPTTPTQTRARHKRNVGFNFRAPRGVHTLDTLDRVFFMDSYVFFTHKCVTNREAFPYLVHVVDAD